ncbi:MAG: MOSC domain-containing protein [Caldilineaceae bacterium]
MNEQTNAAALGVTHRTTAEIEAAAAALGPAPLDVGTLELIVSRPLENERLVLERGLLSTEVGLEGDSWLPRGSRSMPDGRANPAAQLTLMNSRVIHALAPNRTDWPPAGDQLFVDLDLSESNLPAGQRLAIGDAIIEVSALPHTGCAKFTARYGHDAIRYINGPDGRAERRRGLNARVLVSGPIRTGDLIRKLPASG